MRLLKTRAFISRDISFELRSVNMFENTTQLTYQKHLELLRYGFKAKLPKLLIFHGMGAIVFLLGLYTNQFFSIILGATFAIIFAPLVYLLERIRSKKNHAKSPIYLKTPHLHFVFDIDRIRIRMLEREEGETMLRYDELFKVGEDRHNLYLYLSPMQAYILSKKTFTLGSANDFKQFISEKSIPHKQLKI
ncbi:MAG: YcxB family protein [Acholeplasmataceae bacterium]|nr:MAG: YcxB family protein [Acholeplasmataceae bacterium]